MEERKVSPIGKEKDTYEGKKSVPVRARKVSRTGRRLAVYSPDLAELRKKEKEIEKDQSEGILTDTQCKNMTLNDLFEIHMDTRKLAEICHTCS